MVRAGLQPSRRGAATDRGGGCRATAGHATWPGSSRCPASAPTRPGRWQRSPSASPCRRGGHQRSPLAGPPAGLRRTCRRRTCRSWPMRSPAAAANRATQPLDARQHGVRRASARHGAGLRRLPGGRGCPSRVARSPCRSPASRPSRLRRGSSGAALLRQLAAAPTATGSPLARRSSTRPGERAARRAGARRAGAPTGDELRLGRGVPARQWLQSAHDPPLRAPPASACRSATRCRPSACAPSDGYLLNLRTFVDKQPVDRHLLRRPDRSRAPRASAATSWPGPCATPTRASSAPASASWR